MDFVFDIKFLYFVFCKIWKLANVKVSILGKIWIFSLL